MEGRNEELAVLLTELNHYFVRANDLERTKDFSVNVLTFEVMPRVNAALRR
jgi:hypothetical protein